MNEQQEKEDEEDEERNEKKNSWEPHCISRDDGLSEVNAHKININIYIKR